MQKTREMTHLKLTKPAGSSVSKKVSYLDKKSFSGFPPFAHHLAPFRRYETNIDLD